MNMSTLARTLLCLVPAALTGCAGAAGTTTADGHQALFARMEEAIRTSNQELFRGQWHPLGYQENLVGGSGLPGSRVFEQGARKKWFLKPDLGASRKVEGVTIVPAEIWSWERNRSVDRLDVAVVSDGGRQLVLGAGEDAAQVDALARRYAKREPLAPPSAPAEAASAPATTAPATRVRPETTDPNAPIPAGDLEAAYHADPTAWTGRQVTVVGRYLNNAPTKDASGKLVSMGINIALPGTWDIAVICNTTSELPEGWSTAQDGRVVKGTVKRAFSSGQVVLDPCECVK